MPPKLSVKTEPVPTFKACGSVTQNAQLGLLHVPQIENKLLALSNKPPARPTTLPAALNQPRGTAKWLETHANSLVQTRHAARFLCLNSRTAYATKSTIAAQLNETLAAV